MLQHRRLRPSSQKIAPHIAKIVVTLDKSYHLSGFCDSGNTLTHNGVPGCFVTKQFGGFADYFAKQVLQGNVQAVTVTTVTGSKVVQAVKGKVSVGNVERDVYLALPIEKCQTVYNVILSNEFCNEI